MSIYTKEREITPTCLRQIFTYILRYNETQAETASACPFKVGVKLVLWLKAVYTSVDQL